MSEMVETVAKALEPMCRGFVKGEMPLAFAREFARAAIAAMSGPNPPKPGDSVRHDDYAYPGIVLFIDDDQAWVKFQEDGRHVVALGELESVDG